MIDKIGAIVIRDRKLLIVRENGSEFFYIPGGKREKGESDIETLKREMKEETGAVVSGEKFYKEFITKAQTANDKVRVRAYFCTLDREPTPSEEIEEVLWVSKDTKAKLGYALNAIIPELIKDKCL